MRIVRSEFGISSPPLRWPAALACRWVLATIIIVSHLPNPASGQVLKVTQDLRIQAETNDLSAIETIAVSPKGIIAVAQPQDNLIRFFDASGRALGTFGRKGEGPGEFQTIVRLGWRNDTLCVFDRILYRFTWIDPAHRLLRTTNIPRTVLAPNGEGTAGLLLPQFQLSNGSFFALLFPQGPATPGWLRLPRQDGAAYVLTGSDGRFERLALFVPSAGPDCSIEVAGAGEKGQAISFTQPFCVTPHLAMGENGSLVRLFDPASTGPSPMFRLAIISLSGDTISDRTYPYARTSIPRQTVDSVRTALAATPRISPVLKAAYQSLDLPKYFPPVRSVLVGLDNTIWLRDGNGVLTTQRWQVLSPQGKVVGTVELPLQVTLVVAVRNTVWALETDTDGVHHIVRFRVS